jgi:hypothetical protein
MKDESSLEFFISSLPMSKIKRYFTKTKTEFELFKTLINTIFLLCMEMT